MGFPTFIKEFPFFGSNRAAVILSVKVSFFHVVCELTDHVSCWFISSDNVRTLHTILGCFSSPYTKLKTSFPNHLSEMTSSWGKSSIIEIIAWVTDLIIPKIGNIVVGI